VKFGWHLAVIVCGMLVQGACSKKIGDACRSSIDCSQESERLCDISQPGGYCTIEGCDERSCPEEAVCIRFFPRLFLTKSCKDNAAACAADEVCLEADGLCAPRTSERRFCALACGNNGDCRGQYECREAGKGGSLPLVTNPARKVSFCAPQDQ
jgi:hypothetical protein